MPSPSDPFADVEAEQFVCFAVMTDPRAAVTVAPLLKATDFTVPLHKAIYYYAGKLFHGGMAPDPLAIAKAIEAEPRALAALGGVDLKTEIGFLLDFAPSTANVEHYAKLVRACAVRRLAADRVGKLLADLREPSFDVTDTMQRAFVDLLGLSVGTEGGFQRLDLARTIDAIANRGRDPHATVKTGFPALDQQFHGFRDGELVIVGGSAKSGKTTFTINVARNVADHHTTGIVSCEMNQESLEERLLNAEARVSVRETSSGQLDQPAMERMMRAASVLQPLPLYIDDAVAPTLEQVRCRVLELKARDPNLRFVVVDYLQLMSASVARGQSTADRLTDISYGLKGLAKQAKVVVWAPCQLNYKDIDKEDREPEVRDLQGSSGMFQAADAVLLCWRAKLGDGSLATETFNLKAAGGRRNPAFRTSFDWHGRYFRVLPHDHA